MNVACPKHMTMNLNTFRPTHYHSNRPTLAGYLVHIFASQIKILEPTSVSESLFGCLLLLFLVLIHTCEQPCDDVPSHSPFLEQLCTTTGAH
ncbi:hypothetical protein RSAG8_09414, partial [Rhizoctonia solani AG-8 WAC10335]